MSSLRGQHIASVTPDSFDCLSIHKEQIRNTGSEIDHVIEAPNDAQNGRLLIYVNGLEPKFQTPRNNFVITLERLSLSNPLYFGILACEQAILGEPSPKGVTIISGWNPTKPQEDGFDFLYIRCE